MSNQISTNYEQNQQVQQEVQAEKSLKEKVFETCDIMHAENKKITRAAVREVTGGSDRDLSKYINEWKEQQALTVQNQGASFPNSGTVSSSNQALAVQKAGSKSISTGTHKVQKEGGQSLSVGTQEVQQRAYSTAPQDDLSQIARRGAERAAALMVGEDAVVAHLLENPDKLPEDLRQQVEAYRSRTTAAVEKRQEQYNPDFFAQMAIAQFQ